MKTKSPDLILPWFIVGCLFVVMAFVLVLWGFALGELNPSRRFLLMWLLPMTSGFACGCFAGSMKASGPLGNLAIAATGGFAVWLLSYFLLPQIPPPAPTGSGAELRKLIQSQHDEIRTKLKEASKTTTQPEKFKKVQKDLEDRLLRIEEACNDNQDIRFRQETKRLVDFLNSDPAREVLPPELLERFKEQCYEPPRPDPMKDLLGIQDGIAT